MQIKEYLNMRGIKQKWFAEQIGISRRYLNLIVNYRRPLPNKYWTQVIVASNGKITMDDLVKHRENYERIAFEKKADLRSGGELPKV